MPQPGGNAGGDGLPGAGGAEGGGGAGDRAGPEHVDVRRREPPPGDSPFEGFAAARVGSAAAAFAALKRRPGTRLGSLALILACLCFFLPGFFAMPPVDRDESRFAQASRQMFESVALAPSLRDPARHGGGLVLPMVQDRARLNKPPLIYWLQAGSGAVFAGGNPFRDRIWMYRVPSLGAGIVLVLSVYHLGSRMFDRRTGWLAGLLLAACPVVAWEAHQARADLVMVAFTAAAMAAMYRVASGEGRAAWRDALVFWVALAGGIMTKGPIAPMVAILGALAYSIGVRRWRWMLRLRPALGISILAVCIGPWVWAVSRQVGWEAYLGTITRETIGRGLAAREGHWAPPGYHLVLLPVLFWPGSLLTAAGIGVAWRAVRAWRRGGPGLRSAEAGDAAGAYAYCLAWIVPAWVIFELAGTKLPHYTMPLYPAVALLSARAVLLAQAGVLRAGRGVRIGAWVWLGIGGAIVLAAAAGLVLTGMMERARGGAPLGLVVRAAAGVLILLIAARAGWRAARALRSGAYVRAQAWAVLVQFLACIVVLKLVAPRAMDLSRRVAAAIEAADPSRSLPVAALGYHEDSLVYLTRGRAERLGDEEADAWWRKHPDGVMVVPTGRLTRSHMPRGEVWGLNYSKGRFERLSIVGWSRP
jgi:4-amino-4-deoxy-L-arabinose transferase-like glycosyltransferase